MERRQNCIWNHQGEITQKVWKRELSFLYETYRHDLFYITVRYHDYIPKGIQVTEGTWICIIKSIKGEISHKYYRDSSHSVCDTSPWPVLHNCEISSKYSKWFQVIEQTQKCLWMDGQMDGHTDGRTPGLIAISCEPFGRGIKMQKWP